MVSSSCIWPNRSIIRLACFSEQTLFENGVVMSSNFGGLDILVFVFNGFDMIQVSFGYREKKL